MHGIMDAFCCTTRENYGNGAIEKGFRRATPVKRIDHPLVEIFSLLW